MTFAESIARALASQDHVVLGLIFPAHLAACRAETLAMLALEPLPVVDVSYMRVRRTQ